MEEIIDLTRDDSDHSSSGGIGGNTNPIPAPSAIFTPEPPILQRGFKSGVRNQQNTSHKSWCFTWNNYTMDDVDTIRNWPYVSKGVVGFEIGEEKETPHLQGVVVFKKSIRFNKFRDMCKLNHVERMKKWEAASEYCKKEGNFFLIGIFINLLFTTFIFKKVAKITTNRRQGSDRYCTANRKGYCECSIQ